MLDPSRDLVHEGMAICLCNLKRLDSALASADLALRERPDRWQSYDVVGLVHLARGDPKPALQSLSEGIMLDSTVAALFIHRAAAFEALKRYEEAESDLRAARSKDPTSTEMERIEVIIKRLLKVR